MDTKGKIVRLSAWNPPTLKPLVSGYFDPLLEWHVERLEALANELGPLTVLIMDSPGTILPAASRAVVVAGLGCVEKVLLAGTSPLPEARLKLEEQDAVLRAGFLQYVLDRET